MDPIDISVCRYGADVILKFLNAFKIEINGVSDAKSIESIHRMRVATRRLHVALTIFQDCFPDKKLKLAQKHLTDMRSSLGAARDLDVKIELLQSQVKEITDKSLLPGLNRLILRLKQERSSQQKLVIVALELLQNKKSIDHLDKSCQEILSGQEEQPVYTSILYQLANDMILARLKKVYFYEQYIICPDCVKEIHAMRIAIKRLRYSIETFSSLYPDSLDQYLAAARKSQEMLGNIHDCDVWIQFLPEFLIKEQKRSEKFYGTSRYFNRVVPGIQYFINNQQEKRNQVYSEFVSQWQSWKEENLWESLKSNVSKYTIDPNGMYNHI
jgi:CHAD domain-containing protein